MTRALADGRRVTGVDISARQIELARANVPDATFIHADMTALDLPPASLDAVVAFYSLTHVPRADLPDAARRRSIAGCGRAASSSRRWAPRMRRTRSRHDWLGAPMFFSHHGAKKNRALVRRAGFEIEEAVVEEEPEDRHAALFLWVVAHKPAVAGRSVPDGPSRHPGPADASLPPAIRDAIVAQARAEYPNEACGLIVGDCAGGGGWRGAALRGDPEQGGVAVPLRDRPDRPVPPDDRGGRRRRGHLGHRPLAHPHPGGAVADRHRPGLLPGRLYLLVSLERGRGRSGDRRPGRPGVADRRRADPRGEL